MEQTDKRAEAVETPALEELIGVRRAHLDANGMPGCQPARWGLALSGGGIRSATFCYGLITALAKAKVLWRFDLMSTVSGGGYIGAMLGRMALATSSAKDLQDKLGIEAEASHHRRWLRANSRYLIPRGSQDWLFAIVTFLRNLAGVHMELGVLGMLLGCVLGGVDLMAWWTLDQWIKDPLMHSGPTTPLDIWKLVSPWPTLWLLLPLPMTWAVGAALWYWYMPAGIHRPEQADERRQNVTEQLAVALNVCVAVLMLGAIDWVAWRIANKPSQLVLLGAGFTVILAVLRTLLPLVQQGGTSISDFLRQRLPLVMDLAGKFGILMIVTFWTAVVHAVATRYVWNADLEQVDFLRATLALLLMAGGALSWLLLSGRSLEFLNRSSLHHFYRARLSHAYLGAANPARTGNSKVTHTHAADDVPLGQYDPHAHGGPVHIINVCINQTFQHHGLHNLDRQGELMSIVGPGHYRVEGHDWRPLRGEAAATLGTWMAVSGAAAAPGLGCATRPGLAAMLTTLGVRLGYWWNAGRDGEPLPWYGRWLPKYSYLLSELLAQFAGSNSRIQYLSDGGHCENTAAYPLLVARCKLIVLADCGADPEFRFGDLENLIRRARIDLNIDIRFVRPNVSGAELFGSLDDLASSNSPACIALARVDYPDDPEPGVLVLVKPNLTTGLPEDLYNYSRDHPRFPHETTADQFFDEAQWESYFSLGRHLGTVLDEANLLAMPDRVIKESKLDDHAATQLGSAPKSDSPGEGSKPVGQLRRPSRIGAKSAATAGLGLGVMFSAASGLWAAFQNASGEDGANNQIDPQLLRPLYNTYATLPLAPSDDKSTESIGRMAAQLMTVWQTVRTNHQDTAFQRNKEALDMLRTTYGLCQPLSGKLAVCRTLLSTFECPTEPVVSPVSQNFGYWARDEPGGSPRRKARAHSYCEAADGLGEEAVVPPQLAAAQVAPPPPPALPSTVGSGGGSIVGTVISRGSGSVVLPAPVTSERTVPAPPAAVARPAAPLRGACSGVTVFVQVYGPQGKENVASLRARWRAAGADVPSIEDVADTARRQGRDTPTPYSQPTVIYHLADSKSCAETLVRLATPPLPPLAGDAANRLTSAAGTWEIKPLDSRFTGSKKTVEVWLPPAIVQQGFDRWADYGGYCYQEKIAQRPGVASFGVHCHPTRPACEDARGPNPNALQSACTQVVLPGNGRTLLPFNGWGGSRYNLANGVFAAPFPALPDSGKP
ncbi:patatin-like phospholipase domain-containing protein [Chitinimonas naiadis]